MLGHRKADLACVALLALACLCVRLPALDEIALNPDESQYEGSASYLVATGTSAFEYPYGSVYTVAVYKLVASIFGPYSMLQVRVLVLLTCLGITVLLYGLVRSQTNRWCGLMSMIWKTRTSTPWYFCLTVPCTASLWRLCMMAKSF